jgi:hypothetical protein
MPTKIYDSDYITLVDGTKLYITPLKIKYLREFMSRFEGVKISKNDEQAIDALSECVLLTMQQYYPAITTIEQLQDNMDMTTIYKILEISAGIKIKDDSKEDVKKQALDSSSTWDNLDLAKLESEAFLLGIWKDYEELEVSLSMPELTSILNAKREDDYNHKKFLAAMQGVDLDKNSGKQNAWEEMKARVFSKNKTGDPNDVLALQGQNARKAGFGIGMGLSYERIEKE